jgi:ABC-type transport system involved in multi-copper enzyme maturation permease subunit
MLITNEYSYKTNRQNIIDGWSREQFMRAKLTDVALMSLIVTLLFTLVSLIIGLTNRNGTDFQVWPMSYYIGLFALQTFSQLSLAFLTGFLLRKSFFALSVFCFYFIILEPIAVNVLKYKFKSSLGEFFPLEISQRLLPKPAFFEKFDQAAYQATLDAIKYHVAYTILLCLITWGFCFWLNHRRDL